MAFPESGDCSFRGRSGDAASAAGSVATSLAEKLYALGRCRGEVTTVPSNTSGPRKAFISGRARGRGAAWRRRSPLAEDTAAVRRHSRPRRAGLGWRSTLVSRAARARAAQAGRARRRPARPRCGRHAAAGSSDVTRGARRTPGSAPRRLPRDARSRGTRRTDPAPRQRWRPRPPAARHPHGRG